MKDDPIYCAIILSSMSTFAGTETETYVRPSIIAINIRFLPDRPSGNGGDSMSNEYCDLSD